jgi:hypothetical protein
MLELRLQLANARTDLRSAKDDHELAKAQAEQHAIDSGVNGKNADERARNLTLALAMDQAYQAALRALRAAEAEVERLDALLEGARDARRADEWAIRAKLADGLFRAGVQSDDRDVVGDGVWSDTTDWAVGQTAEDVAWQQHMGTYDNGTIVTEDMPF